MSTPRRRTVAVTVILALVALTTSCTGDDDDGARPATTTPVTTAPAITAAVPATTTAPSTTQAATTTTTPPPPPPVAVRAVVEPLTDTFPTSNAGELLAAANGRGHLLIGSRQEAPGLRFTTALWESGDGVRWSSGADNPAFGEGASSNGNVATWHGTELLVGGVVETEAGSSRAAVWTAPDGLTFGASVDPFGVGGYVAGLTSSPWGPIVAGATVEDGVTSRPVVAVRRDGTWTAVTLPVGGEAEAGVGDVAANETTIVATGWVRVGEIDQAAAWWSTDGGATFTAADVAGAHHGLGSYLDTIVTGPGGFASLACTGVGDRSATALVTTADGVTWQRADLEVTDPDGQPVANTERSCSSLTANGDRFLVGWVGAAGRPWVLDIGGDGRGTARYAPRGRGRRSVAAPLAVPLPDGTVGVVSDEGRGFSSGVATDAGSSPTGSGLPVSRQSIVGVGIVTLVDQLLGRGIRAIVTELPGGGFRNSSEPVWATSADGSSWSASDDAVPDDARFVRSGNGVDLAFGRLVDEPGDDPANRYAGATASWIRRAGEPWSAVGAITTGPALEELDDAVAVPNGFVAVGTTTSSGEDGRTTYTPITISSGDGITWNLESSPAPSDQTWLDQLCPMPGGGALALGGTIVDGTWRLHVVRRDLAGIWAEVDPAIFPPDVDDISDCDLVAGTTVLVTQSSDLRPLVYTTTDGVTFTPSVVDVPGVAAASINALVVSGDRLFGAGGVNVDRNVDAALWSTTDGTTWERVPVDGLGGPVDQTALDAAALASGAIVIVGQDRGAPVTWTVLPP